MGFNVMHLIYKYYEMAQIILINKESVSETLGYLRIILSLDSVCVCAGERYARNLCTQSQSTVGKHSCKCVSFDLEFKWSALVLRALSPICSYAELRKTERIKGAHEHSRRKYAANIRHPPFAIRLLQLHLKTHTPPHREPRSELGHTERNKRCTVPLRLSQQILSQFVYITYIRFSCYVVHQPVTVFFQCRQGQKLGSSRGQEAGGTQDCDERGSLAYLPRGYWRRATLQEPEQEPFPGPALLLLEDRPEEEEGGPGERTNWRTGE